MIPWQPGAGVPLTRRMIARDAMRFGITIAGVGMSVVLMLFLLALYEGVRIESNGWVASRPVDAWVAQVNTTNFIKASSFLPAEVGDALRAVPGVREATPLLRLITLLERPGRRVTAIVVGMDPASDAARPDVVDGSAALEPAGIVLDRALAARLAVHVGDTITLEGRPFHVQGMSRGTNSVLTQYAFIPLADAQALLGMEDVASYFLVRAAPGTAPAMLLDTLRSRVAHVAVLGRDEFAGNNMEELRGGLVPILATVAVLGGVVAFVVLTLLLYGTVLERREDYALLKAIGAPSSVLARVMLGQALAAVAGGIGLGLVAYALAVPLAARWAPAVPLALAWRTALVVAGAALLTGALGALLPLRRIARIHPAEVFQA